MRRKNSYTMEKTQRKLTRMENDSLPMKFSLFRTSEQISGTEERKVQLYLQRRAQLTCQK